MFHTGVGCSSINTARSALSVLIEPINGFTLGKRPIIQRYMKGIFDIPPSLPKYTTTWNPNFVLNYINSFPVNDDLTLKQLSHKLATLLCLMYGQRDQIISKLSINHMTLTDEKCTFYVPAILKTTRPGYHQPPIEFLGFPKNEKLSIISTLNVYLKKTKNQNSY